MLTTNLKRIMALLAFLTLLGVSTLPLSQGFNGGYGDGDQDYGDCVSCHGPTGGGNLTIEADGLQPEPSTRVTVSVEVTEQALGDSGKLGVFLLRSLNGSDDHPAEDGWTIESDPNGNQNNYVELEAPGTGLPVEFNWTLTAPDQEGLYHLYALAIHGGEGSVHEELTAGLEINVSVSPLPRFLFHNEVNLVLTDEPIFINASLKDDEGVVEAIIFYREPGAEDYQTIAMQLVSGTTQLGEWEGYIPAQTRPGLLYYDIVITDRENYVTCHEPQHLVRVVGSGIPVIEHVALTTALVNHDLPLKVKVKNLHDSATLAYREPGETGFTTLKLTLLAAHGKTSNYTAVIPGQALAGPLHYYINATNGTQSVTTGLFTITVSDYHDLLPLSMELLGQPSRWGETQIRVTVLNNGSLPVQRLWVGFNEQLLVAGKPQGEPQLMGWVSNISIAPYSEHTLRVWWLPQLEGSHRVTVVVDTDDSFDEVNETNNELNATYQVGPHVAQAHEMPLELAQPHELLGLMVILGSLALGLGGRETAVQRSSKPRRGNPGLAPRRPGVREEICRESDTPCRLVPSRSASVVQSGNTSDTTGRPRRGREGA